MMLNTFEICTEGEALICLFTFHLVIFEHSAEAEGYFLIDMYMQMSILNYTLKGSHASKHESNSNNK